jgi:MoaA/NifB/PqqE/SkfB family radical SAM enzyme
MQVQDKPIRVEKPIRVWPQTLYVEPTSVCNLHCRMCYTNVINGANRRVVSRDTVLDFVDRYLSSAAPSTLPVYLYWCGTGEIFLHPDFPAMANLLLEKYPETILQQGLQTNGTIRRLREFPSLARLDFYVSIDGLRDCHEWHRGPKTYDRTVDFCREAVDLGCRSMSIRCLLTRDNIHRLDEFETELRARIGESITFFYHAPYTSQVLREVRDFAPGINQVDIEDNRAVGEAEAVAFFQANYQGRREVDTNDAVDNFLCLTTYGVHTCCHGIINIGEPSTDMPTLMQRMHDSESQCRGCGMFPCQ